MRESSSSSSMMRDRRWASAISLGARRAMTSGSSSSASVSASSAIAPTGVFSSWLMLATRSVRTESRPDPLAGVLDGAHRPPPGDRPRSRPSPARRASGGAARRPRGCRPAHARPGRPARCDSTASSTRASRYVTPRKCSACRLRARSPPSASTRTTPAGRTSSAAISSCCACSSAVSALLRGRQLVPPVLAGGGGAPTPPEMRSRSLRRPPPRRGRRASSPSAQPSTPAASLSGASPRCAR